MVVNLLFATLLVISAASAALGKGGRLPDDHPKILLKDGRNLVCERGISICGSEAVCHRRDGGVTVVNWTDLVRISK